MFLSRYPHGRRGKEAWFSHCLRGRISFIDHFSRTSDVSSWLENPHNTLAARQLAPLCFSVCRFLRYQLHRTLETQSTRVQLS